MFWITSFSKENREEFLPVFSISLIRFFIVVGGIIPLTLCNVSVRTIFEIVDCLIEGFGNDHIGKFCGSTLYINGLA